MSAAQKILIVEDETSILMALEDDLRFEGYDVETASDGPTGLRKATEEDPDLVILDVMLPGLDGFEVCRRLRAEGIRVPVLMLTAKSQEVDTVLGLELGADDYVTKPFSPRELLARVKALLRRTRLDTEDAERMDRFAFGDVEVDFRKYEARKGGSPWTSRGRSSTCSGSSSSTGGTRSAAGKSSTACGTTPRRSSSVRWTRTWPTCAGSSRPIPRAPAI